MNVNKYPHESKLRHSLKYYYFFALLLDPTEGRLRIRRFWEQYPVITYPDDSPKEEESVDLSFLKHLKELREKCPDEVSGIETICSTECSFETFIVNESNIPWIRKVQETWNMITVPF